MTSLLHFVFACAEKIRSVTVTINYGNEKSENIGPRKYSGTYIG